MIRTFLVLLLLFTLSAHLDDDNKKCVIRRQTFELKMEDENGDKADLSIILYN